MASIKTPWFKRGTQPVHEGVYETEHGFQWYSPHSMRWFGYGSDVLAAQDQFIVDYESGYQKPKWRGFTTKQN